MTGRVLLTIAMAASAAAFVHAIPRHLADPAWPPHAKNHVLQALIWVVGFNALGVWLVWGPLRSGVPGAWTALALAGACQFGGYFAPNRIVAGGAVPGWLDKAYFASLALLYAAGLFLARG